MFIELGEVFLQIEIFEQIGLPLIISLIVNVAIVTIMMRQYSHNVKATKDESNSRYAQILRDFNRDIIEHEKSEPDCKDPLTADEQFKDFVIYYINILQTIAYLNLKKKIPDDIADYFEREFELANGFKEWYLKVEEEDKKSITYWKIFDEYCTKKNIQTRIDDFESFYNNWDTLQSSKA